MVFATGLGSALKGWATSTVSTDGHGHDHGHVEVPPESPGMECPEANVHESSGEVMLVDPECPQAEVWQHYKQWAAATFQDSDDYMQKLTSSGRMVGDDDKLHLEDFFIRVRQLGWDGAH